jgi:hypothetical protein
MDHNIQYWPETQEIKGLLHRRMPRFFYKTLASQSKLAQHSDPTLSGIASPCLSYSIPRRPPQLDFLVSIIR